MSLRLCCLHHNGNVIQTCVLTERTMQPSDSVIATMAQICHGTIFWWWRDIVHRVQPDFIFKLQNAPYILPTGPLHYGDTRVHQRNVNNYMHYPAELFELPGNTLLAPIQETLAGGDMSAMLPDLSVSTEKSGYNAVSFLLNTLDTPYVSC